MGFCYQKNFSNPTLPVDEPQFWGLVKATSLAQASSDEADRFGSDGH